MSADAQGGAGRREVAYRLFAAEFDDADLEHTENDADERAPNYVVTPTGARVNRLFVVGVLTEVERVNEEMLRGRVVDPTGAFVVYAGQYQPDQLTVLERLDPPAFVAVTGKARTFQPEDSEQIYTSVRPESITEVDSDTRDRWTVEAARHTVDRVATFAAALQRSERGVELRAALEADGADEGLAAGIPLAIDHYETTPAYFDGLRTLAVQAAEVVAGEREEVEALDRSPDDDGDVTPADLLEDVDVEDLGTSASPGDVETPVADSTTEPSEPGAATTGESDAEHSDPTVDAETGSPTIEQDSEAAPASDVTDPQASAAEETEEPDESTEAEAPPMEETEEVDSEPSAAPDVATDEIYEFDEGEREEIEAEFDTDFSTGSEIESPSESESAESTAGASDTEVPEDTSSGDAALDATGSAGTEDAAGADESADTAAVEADADVEATESTDDESSDEEPDTDSTDVPDAETGESTAEPAGEVDLEEAVVEAMRDLDDGDGASRDDVVADVSESVDASAEAVEDAIDEALMSGKCYEPGEGRLKAI